jgi:RNA polymerase sigma factor (TIGR02999 family)
MSETSTGSGDVTALLRLAEDGDAEALDRVFPLVYHELQRIARAQLGRERAGHTLQATALVNEAYLKLVQRPPRGTSDRGHFLGVAARAMRQVLVDHARAWSANKRGGGAVPVTLNEELAGVGSEPEDILALDQALDRLDALDERLRRVVELRYFAGLQDDEIAEALGVTRRTVQRDWVKARAWLHRELAERHEGGVP